MALTRHQKRTIRKVIQVGRNKGYDPHLIRAALATIWVESQARNLKRGDRDSLGAFQQRPSQGWGTPEQVTRVRYAARQFYNEARRQYAAGERGGALAQAVQRSAYPDKYGREWDRAGRQMQKFWRTSQKGKRLHPYRPPRHTSGR